MVALQYSPGPRPGGLFMAIALLLIVGVIAWGIILSHQRKGALRQLAERFGGTLTEGWFSGSRVDFVVDTIPVQLTYHPGSQHQRRYTRIRFQWTPPGTLRLRPEGIFASLGRVFGAQDIQIGDAGFDRTYVIQGQPEAWIRQVLDPGMRDLVRAVGEIGPGGWGRPDVRLEAGPSGVSLSVDRNLVDAPEDLNLFVERGLRLFRLLRAGPVAEGVKILSADECTVEGKCPVCANPLGASPHRCPTCATPHHADCWGYFGGCATYACGRKSG